jgi:dephospho-CoA kinase
MMLIIGLTGSIGMGKSTAAARIRALGIGVCDADAAVHKLYKPGGAAVSSIETAFPGTTTAEGGVDRPKLAAALLADPSAFEQLERIVHPLVFQVERNFLHEKVAKGAEKAVLEIPLLFETGGERRVDVTIVVSSPPEIQRERVLARPGMVPEKLDQILSRQMSDEEKRQRADFVVDTSRSIPETEAQIDRIMNQLIGRQGTAFAEHWA